jgi:hypothetical protein
MVDARLGKYVTGRMSDLQDWQSLQRLMSYGLLREAFGSTRLRVCDAKLGELLADRSAARVPSARRAPSAMCANS